MARKPQVPPTPEMTSLPMNKGDSPLVIDLPDGQKLVVGNLAAGSVIEVATWRGTGRPDSRTSRLMLGMSSGQDKPTDSAPSEPKKDSSFIGKVVGVFGTIVGKAGGPPKSTSKSRVKKKSNSALIKKVKPAAPATEADKDGNWLNSTLEKSAIKQNEKQVVAKTVSKKAAPKKRTPKKSVTAKKTAKKTVKKTAKKSTARRAR